MEESITTTTTFNSTSVKTDTSVVKEKPKHPRPNFTGHLKEELVFKIVSIDGDIQDVVSSEKKYWVF